MRPPSASDLSKNNRVLITSPDRVITREYCKAISEALGGMNIVWVDDVADLLDAARGDILWASDVVLVHVLHQDELKDLMGLTTAAPGGAVVLLEEETLTHEKNYKNLRGICIPCVIEDPTPEQCVTWLKRKLSAKGIVCHGRVVEEMVARRGPDLSCLERDMHKLILMSKGSGLSVPLVHRTVPVSAEMGAFELAEAVLKRRVPEALAFSKRVADAGMVHAVHTVITQARRMCRALSLREQGLSDDDAAVEMGVPKFIYKTKMCAPAAAFGYSKLVKGLDILAGLDKELRTSRFPKREIFELGLLRVMRPT